MAHISGDDRSQLLLLPDAVDDYVGSDNPVRFIDGFVDSLDLAAAGFQRVQPKDTGRPGYDPADLLKLYIYGYLNRVRLSRQLEAETHRNLEVTWLAPAAEAGLQDDRRLPARQPEGVPGGLPRLRAPVPRARPLRTRVDRQCRPQFHQGRACGRIWSSLTGVSSATCNNWPRPMSATTAAGRTPLATLRTRSPLCVAEGHVGPQEDPGGSGEAQLSLSDPDARALAPSKRVRVGYTVQIAFDAKHNLIAEQQVHSKVTDLGLLAETATAARENLDVDTIDAVADRGYFKIEDIEDCEANGVTPFVPKPDRSLARSRGRFPKSASATTPSATPTSVLLARVWSHATEARWPSTGTALGRSSTPTWRRAGPASCETSAPAQRSEGSSAMRTKQRWIGWPNVSRPAPRSWRGAGNRSNIRPARSSSAWVRAPS